jgi:hypothetical protein
MTTFAFTPSNTTPFQFQPTLDGDIYNCLVKWGLFGQRWYLVCSDLSGNPIFTVAMVGSPPGYDISLTAGYFTSTIVFRQADQIFEVSP